MNFLGSLMAEFKLLRVHPALGAPQQPRAHRIGNRMLAIILQSSCYDSTYNNCVFCSTQVHPLRSCIKFMIQSVEERYSTVKFHRICSGCKHQNRCRRCHGNHHTLLHRDSITDASASAPRTRRDTSSQPAAPVDGNRILSNTAVKLQSRTLLMTSQPIVSTPSGTAVQARALLDTGSAASFISERLVASLTLPRVRQIIRISGIAGSSLTD